MRKTKKTLAILAIVAMVLAMLPVQVFAATTSAADSDRYAGTDRIGTALAVAANWTSANAVVLAPADDANLVDALAAAPLAGQENAPILLTYKDGLNADVKAKIAALGASKVYVVGAAANDAVVNALTGVTVEKLTGADRWATAAAINAKLTNVAGTFVVGYDAIADALSAASYAAANKYQIALTNVDGSVDASRLAGSKTYLVGGTGVVKDYAGATARFGGADRYATNTEVVKGLSYEYSKVYIANGDTLVDALVAAPLAAQAKAAVLLADPYNSSVAAASEVNGKLSSTSKVIALGGTGVVSDAVKGSVSYTAPAVLSVESVSAIDLGQIKVTFNKALDKDAAVDPLNYTLVAKNSGVANLTGATYTLSDDKTYVTIDLATLLTNQKNYTLTVKDVRDAAGVKISETSKDFSTSDLTLPTVSKVEITGTKTIKVTMSENVDATQDRVSFKLDNGTLSAPTYAVGTSTAREVITLTLAAELSAGAHTLTVEAVKDLAGLYSVKADFPLSYAKDTTAPTVSIKEIKSDAKTVVLKFNKDIDSTTLVNNANIKFSHTYKGSNEVTGAAVTKKTNSEYEVAFVNALPPGTSSIFIEYASGITDSQKVKDLFSNVFVDPVTLTATVTADFTAPTVTSVSQKDADEIYVNFSEDVNAADAQITGNYKLVNSKNETVNLASAPYVAADKRTTLKAAANLEAGAYTLEVKNIYDKAVVPNKMTTATFNIDVLDKVAPVVSAAAWTAADKKITIKFSKDMVGSELTTLSNYALTVDNASKDWPTGTAVALKDSKTVEITLGSSVTGLDADLGGTDSVQLSGAFKSAAGVAIGGISVTKTLVVDTSIVPAYVADSAKVTGKDEVTFELDAELKAIDPAKITFNGAGISSASYVNNGSKAVVTLKLTAALADTSVAGWNAGTGIQTIAGGGAYTAKFGGAEAGSVTLVAGSAIKDKAAPYLKTVVTSDGDADGQIDTLTLTMSESVIGSTVAASDFSVSNSYSINSITSVNAATVVLKINESGLPDTGVKPSVAVNSAIEDLANNATSSGDAVVSTDGAKPVVSSVVLVNKTGGVAGTLEAGDQIIITYDEAVTVTGVTAGAAAVASTTTVGDLTTAGTIAGFGTFASAGTATVPTLTNTVALSADGKTVTITLGTPTGAAPSGVFTAIAGVTDVATNAVNTTFTVIPSGSF